MYLLFCLEESCLKLVLLQARPEEPLVVVRTLCPVEGKTGAGGTPDLTPRGNLVEEEKKVVKANFCKGPTMCEQKQVEDVGSEER